MSELQELSCRHCKGSVLKKINERLQQLCPDHPGLCCDCFDLTCGMPLDQLNEERAGKGLPPLPPIWEEKP